MTMGTDFAPLISVIVPVYNGAAYVGRCLESILAQDYRNIEVIVVDDGSTDDSARICREYAVQDARVTLVRQGHAGVSAARNAGLERAIGEYVTFVDSDDYIDREMFAQYVKYLSDSREDIAISGYKVVNKISIIEEIRLKYRKLSAVDALQNLYRDDTYRNYLWNKLYKRKLFNGIRFPNGKVYEDISIQYKLFERASKFIQCNFVAYNYIQHKESITHQYNLSNIYDYIDAQIERFKNVTIKNNNIIYYLVRGIFRAYIALKFCEVINILNRNKFYIRSHDIDARIRALSNEVKQHLPLYKYLIMRIGCCGLMVTNTIVALLYIGNKLRHKIICYSKIDTIRSKGDGLNWLGWLPGCHTDGSWIFLDRDTHADDNAEHLYRWLRQHHPEQRIFFALRHSSPDWNRLDSEGFTLLDIASKQYLRRRICASMVVSSQADDYIFDPFSIPNKMPFKKLCTSLLNWMFAFLKRDCRYIFLQHGVIMNDLSDWLNSKPISLFITTTPKEYQSIIGDQYGYRFTKKETKLTGLPRFDALVPYIGTIPRNRQVTVMPSWRSWLLGETLHSNARVLKNDFTNSRYARTWQEFLNCEGLRRLQMKYGFAIVFCPHVNMQPYLPQFRLPAYVQALSLRETSIQKIIAATSLLVTDYSSVAFDQAFLLRPVAYYQFDYEEFFSGQHVVSRGYYDYSRDGFGPVDTSEQGVVDAISESAIHDFKPLPTYLKRMQQAFPWRDGHNCERVYKAMCA